MSKLAQNSANGVPAAFTFARRVQLGPSSQEPSYGYGAAPRLGNGLL